MTWPNVPSTVFTEREGVLRVAAVVNEARCLWRETPMHDVGLDGQIEYVDSEGNATGRIVLVQVKSGDSYFVRRSNSGYRLRPSVRHLTYWERAPLPVVLILHRPSDGATYWTDARDQIRRGETDLNIPVSQPFNRHAVREALRRDGPLPVGPVGSDQLIAAMIESKSPSAEFPVDYFDLFVHGLLELGRTLYFGMELATGVGDAKLAAANAPFDANFTFEAYNHLFDYVSFVIHQDIARVDFDSFRRYWEQFEFVTSFMAPLTIRGLALVERIGQLDNSEGVRVAQDKSFQGIRDFEYAARVPVVRAFKSKMRLQRLKG